MMNDNVEICEEFSQSASQRDKITKTKHTSPNELYKWDADKWMMIVC